MSKYFSTIFSGPFDINGSWHERIRAKADKEKIFALSLVLVKLNLVYEQGN